MEGEYCEAENKKMYSRRLAGEVINSARRNYRGYNPRKKRAKVTPQRCYLCQHCGAWHLTSIKAEYRK